MLTESPLVDILRAVPPRQRLRRALGLVGKRQRQCADRLGVSESLISDYTRGRRIPHEEHQLKIARFLGIPREVLFPDSEAA